LSNWAASAASEVANESVVKRIAAEEAQLAAEETAAKAEAERLAADAQWLSGPWGWDEGEEEWEEEEEEEEEEMQYVRLHSQANRGTGRFDQSGHGETAEEGGSLEEGRLEEGLLVQPLSGEVGLSASEAAKNSYVASKKHKRKLPRKAVERLKHAIDHTCPPYCYAHPGETNTSTGPTTIRG
jgi:hypothetical protein